MDSELGKTGNNSDVETGDLDNRDSIVTIGHDSQLGCMVMMIVIVCIVGYVMVLMGFL